MAKTNNTTLTPEQQAIASRSDAQEKLRRPIREDELNDFSLMNNPLDLPVQAAELQAEKIYAFRWCERKAERIDYLTRSEQPPLRWALVTRTTVPELKELVDPLLGCVCRVDQALLYKYWEDHERVQSAKVELAEAGLQAGELEGKKRQMQSKRDDIEVMAGKDQKIGGSDVVVGNELLSNVDNGDGSPLGDLVV